MEDLFSKAAMWFFTVFSLLLVLSAALYSFSGSTWTAIFMLFAGFGIFYLDLKKAKEGDAEAEDLLPMTFLNGISYTVLGFVGWADKGMRFYAALGIFCIIACIAMVMIDHRRN